MYNSILIPMQIFYKSELHSSLSGEAVTIIDALVDLFFLIDIIITFRTTYLDSELSMECRDPAKIRSRYLRGQFLLDFISSVPFNALFQIDDSTSVG